MKRAGFRKIKAGLESANQKTLDRINKGIKVQDIINGCRNAKERRYRRTPHCDGWISLGETKDDALATLDLAKRTYGKRDMLKCFNQQLLYRIPELLSMKRL